METPLDAIDIQILRELQLDGRLSIVDLAMRVGLSPSPCLRRVRHLEERGVVAALGGRRSGEAGPVAAVPGVVPRRARRDRGTPAQHGGTSRDPRRAPELSRGDQRLLRHRRGRRGDAGGRADFQAYERFLEDKILPLPVNDLLSRFVIGTRKPTAPYDLSHIQPVATPDPAADAPAARRRKRR